MTRSGGQLLVDQLVRHAADTVFTVPGESFLPVLDALHDAPIRLITCRHEAGAANMADAYGKLTGRPGICLVTRAPGAAHAAVGVHTAYQDSTPLILLVGQVPRTHLGREAFQELDYTRMFGEMAKWVTTLDDAAGEIVYAPADPRLLQGVFAFGDGQGCASARECLAPLAAGIPCTDISDARIQRVVARKLKAAFAKLDAAAGSGGPKFAYQARKALQVTDVLLSKGVRKHTVSVECRNTVAASLNAALQRIDANAL